MIKGSAKEYLGQINKFLVVFIDRFENSNFASNFKI